VGRDRSSVLRCGRSQLQAIGQCCCRHRCRQLNVKPCEPANHVALVTVIGVSRLHAADDALDAIGPDDEPRSTRTGCFKRLARSAGLPDIDPHDVRHSYAAAGREAEIDWKALSARVATPMSRSP
jgi:hypothetical protein